MNASERPFFEHRTSNTEIRVTICLCYLADPTSTHTVKWVSYFARDSRYEVHLMGWSPPTDPALRGVVYHHLPDELRDPFIAPVRGTLWYSRLWFWAQRRQYQVLLDRIRPDVFDILMINAGEIPAALARRGPLVVTPWGSDLLEYLPTYTVMTRRLLAATMRRADLVLCNSAALADAAVSLGTPEKRIRRVGQIVDLSRFHPGLDRQSARTQAHITGTPVLLSPRSILPLYRIETAIEALAHVRKEFPSAVLVQLGDCTLDADYSGRLQSLIARLELENAVIFTGRQPYDRMPHYFAASDVVLSLPSSDSRPSSIFEAMACGVPTVAGELLQLHEIMVDGETGLLAPLGDGQATGAAVVRLLTEPALRQRVVENALAFVRQEGDYESQMARVAVYYDELLTGQAKGTK